MAFSYSGNGKSLYPYHDRPYTLTRVKTTAAEGENLCLEQTRNKNNLVISISTTPATEFEQEKGGSEALSPIQEASPADEDFSHPARGPYYTSTRPQQAAFGRRLYQPRHQRLDFTNLQSTTQVDSPARLNRQEIGQVQYVTAAESAPNRLDKLLESANVLEKGGEMHGRAKVDPRDLPTRSISRRGHKESAQSSIKGAPKELIPIDRKTSNARYDFLHGALADCENTIVDLENRPEKVTKSYLDRLAELEAIERSGQDLVTQLESEGDFPSSRGHKIEINGCRRPRDTIFVANTINAGRETINNIQASMTDRSCIQEDNESSLASMIDNFDEDSDEEIDWTLNSEARVDIPSRSSYQAPLYSHKNISISDYLREIAEVDMPDDEPDLLDSLGAQHRTTPPLCSSPRTGEVHKENEDIASSPRCVLLEIEKAPVGTPVQDTEEQVEQSTMEAPLICAEQVDVPPDSPTFLDFDMPRTRGACFSDNEASTIPLKSKSRARKSLYKHRRTSSFYGDQWHLEGAASETLLPENSPTSRPSETLSDQGLLGDYHDKNYDSVNDRADVDFTDQNTREEDDENARTSMPANRRRSKSAPVRFSGSTAWRQSFVAQTDESKQPWGTPTQLVQDEREDLSKVRATCEKINFDVSTRSSHSAIRQSNMSELVISREDAVGIFPPFRNRVSIMSRRESRGNTLVTMANHRPQSQISRPPSMIASDTGPDPMPMPLSLPSTALSESCLARSMNKHSPAMKKKNIRKLKIGTPTLLASSSNIPTVDLQQAKLLHGAPHLQIASTPTKSRNRLRNLLASNNSRTNVAQASGFTLKDVTSLPSSKSHCRQSNDYKSNYPTIFAGSHDPRGMKTVQYQYRDKRAELHSPVASCTGSRGEYFRSRGNSLVIEFRGSGFASSDGKF